MAASARGRSNRVWQRPQFSRPKIASPLFSASLTRLVAGSPVAPEGAGTDRERSVPQADASSAVSQRSRTGSARDVLFLARRRLLPGRAGPGLRAQHQDDQPPDDQGERSEQEVDAEGDSARDTLGRGGRRPAHGALGGDERGAEERHAHRQGDPDRTVEARETALHSDKIQHDVEPKPDQPPEVPVEAADFDRALARVGNPELPLAEG